jgi:aconitate hydratase
VRSLLAAGAADFPAVIVTSEKTVPITLHIAALTDDERQILLDGCLMNFYASQKKESNNEPYCLPPRARHAAYRRADG